MDTIIWGNLERLVILIKTQRKNEELIQDEKPHLDFFIPGTSPSPPYCVPKKKSEDKETAACCNQEMQFRQKQAEDSRDVYGF